MVKKVVVVRADVSCFVIPAVVVAVGKRRDEDARHQRLVAGAVDRLGGGHTHGGVGAAVERALEDDDVGLAAGGAGQLDGRFDGFGARVTEEEVVEFVRHE